MHPYFNQAVAGARLADFRRAAERYRTLDSSGPDRDGARAAVAIRRYFNHARAAHQQPLRRPAKRAG